MSAPNPTAASPVGASAASTPRPAPAHHRHHHGSHSCDAALWQHVYHPDRLQVIHNCMTVRGRVDAVRHEPDGDLHILLATRAALVNSGNVAYEHGDLVLEEICQGPVTQADAIDACQGSRTTSRCRPQATGCASPAPMSWIPTTAGWRYIR